MFQQQNEDASEHNQTTASAISFGVATHPGHIAFIRILFEIYCLADAFVKPISPCLAAQ